MLRRANASRGIMLAYQLLQYFPLLLFVGFYLVIGSYSGLIGQLINVGLMYVLFLPLGQVIRSRTGSRLWGALVTALSFQGFMITSAALIAMF